MNKDLVKRLNDAIELNGPRFGPSLVYLILFNPVGQYIFTPESTRILDSRRKHIHDDYTDYILPKAQQIVTAITGDTKNKLPTCREGISTCFQRSNEETIRQKLLKQYKQTLPFALDGITLEGLKKPIIKPMKEEAVKYLRANKRYLVSYRFKEGNKIREKLNIKYKSIPYKNPERLIEFATEIAEAESEFWINYKDYKSLYTDEWLDLMIGDIVGLRIVDTYQKHAQNNMEDIAKNLKGLNVPGFINIRDRFDNHTDRIKKGRPGGIHLTLVDTSLRNHPIEIQYVCLQSEILNRFGEYAHNLYNGRGKKENKNL